MNKCKWYIEDCKRNCKRTATEGSLFCAAHKSMSERCNVTPVSSDLNNECLSKVVNSLFTTEDTIDTTEIPPITKDDVPDDMILDFNFSQYTPTKSGEKEVAQEDAQVNTASLSLLERITSLLEKVAISSESVKKNPVRTYSDKQVLNSAKFIFYRDFKKGREQDLEMLRMRFVNAKLLPENATIKNVPWMTVKMFTDEKFNSLSEVDKQHYMTMARDALYNNYLKKCGV